MSGSWGDVLKWAVPAAATIGSVGLGIYQANQAADAQQQGIQQATQATQQGQQASFDYLNQASQTGRGDILNFSPNALAALASGNQQAIDYLRGGTDYAANYLAPYYEGGMTGFNALHDSVAGGFQNTPGYQFALQEGLGAVNQQYAARGLNNSGAQAKALTQFATGLADQTYNNYVSRATQLAGMSQGAGNALATLRSGFGTGASNLANGLGTNSANTLFNTGTALSNAALGTGNALSNVNQNSTNALANLAMSGGTSAASNAVAMGNNLTQGIQNGLAAYTRMASPLPYGYR